MRMYGRQTDVLFPHVRNVHRWNDFLHQYDYTVDSAAEVPGATIVVRKQSLFYENNHRCARMIIFVQRQTLHNERCTQVRFLVHRTDTFAKRTTL